LAIAIFERPVADVVPNLRRGKKLRLQINSFAGLDVGVNGDRVVGGGSKTITSGPGEPGALGLGDGTIVDEFPALDKASTGRDCKSVGNGVVSDE